MKRQLLPILLLFFFVSSKAQELNWHLTAQAAAVNNHFSNFQGAFLAGFESMEGQQLSFGPVCKGYMESSVIKNVVGGRIYSQALIVNNVSMYIQCDVFSGVKSQYTASRSPMRLESGAGIIYTFYKKIGVSAGYNFGEYNPLSGVRKNSPAVKLVYMVPINNNRGW